MKKIVIHKPGGYDRLVIEDHPDPVPGPDEVLIEVAAIVSEALEEAGIVGSLQSNGSREVLAPPPPED